jgi:hypothetical protein
MSTPLQGLIEKSDKRARMWHVQEVEKLPDPFTLTEITLLGSCSFTGLETRTRRVRRDKLIRLDDTHKEPPPTIARDYLTNEFHRGPIVKHEQFLAVSNVEPAPNFANPTTYEHGFYIDVHATYWSIMQIAGWNVDYWPGKWFAPGRAPSDFPFPEHKVARSCLVACGNLGKITRFVPGLENPFDSLKPGNRLLNLSLVKLIADILNSMAYQAVSLGAVYVNNDGYIAKTEKDAARIIQMVLDWGLEPSVKGEGYGSVKGSGAYRVGLMKSLPWELREAPQPIDRLRPPRYKTWLQKAFTHFSSQHLTQETTGV